MARYALETRALALQRLFAADAEHMDALSRDTQIPTRTLERWRASELLSISLQKNKAGEKQAGLDALTAVIDSRRAPGALVARAFVLRGWNRWQDKDFEGAVADCSAALAKSGVTKTDRIAATLNRGLIRYEAGDCVGAVADYSAVLALPRVYTEGRAIALVNRAMIRERSGEAHQGSEDMRSLWALPGVSQHHLDCAELFCRRSLYLLRE